MEPEASDEPGLSGGCDSGSTEAGTTPVQHEHTQGSKGSSLFLEILEGISRFRVLGIAGLLVNVVSAKERHL